MYKRLKQFWNKRVCLIVVPDGAGTTKKLTLHIPIIQLIAALIVLGALINGGFSFYTYIENHALSSNNHALSDELLVKEDRIARLESIVFEQQTEISGLKGEINKSATYFDQKFNDLREVQSYVDELLVTLNESTDAQINLPIHRSLEERRDVLSTSKEDDVDIIDGQLALSSEDEITRLLKEETTNYAELVEDLTKNLTFLEAQPNLVPTTGRLTSSFGYRRHPVSGYRDYHNGIDLAANRGTPVMASGTGIVTFAGWNGAYGQVIVLDHGYGYKSVYAHLNDMSVHVGDRIKKGNTIGSVGTTGRSTGPHLHFEIHFQDTPVNPSNVLID